MHYGTKRVMKIKKIYCNFVIICCYIANAKAKQRYDLKADELMESILKDAYKGKFQHRFPSPKNNTQVTSKSIASTAQTKLPYVRTTHAIPLAKLENDMTVEQFFLRKRDLDLGTILESTMKHIPNFESEEDEITIQTRRYNGIKESHRRMNSLREIYFDADNATIILKEKTQTLNLMAQFVYETRYHLPYAQLLRKKYKNHLKYQLGYCFALIRHLKQQQMVLYSTLKSYYGRKNDDSQVIMSLFTHLKLFEKIVKLDVDIKDLIKLILQLDKRRKQLSTTESVSSTKFRPQ